MDDVSSKRSLGGDSKGLSDHHPEAKRTRRAAEDGDGNEDEDVGAGAWDLIGSLLERDITHCVKKIFDHLVSVERLFVKINVAICHFSLIPLVTLRTS